MAHEKYSYIDAGSKPDSITAEVMNVETFTLQPMWNKPRKNFTDTLYIAAVENMNAF